MKPPDLQELVERSGGYDRITAKAWAEWDAAMEIYRARVRALAGGKPAPKLPKS